MYYKMIDYCIKFCSVTEKLVKHVVYFRLRFLKFKECPFSTSSFSNETGGLKIDNISLLDDTNSIQQLAFCSCQMMFLYL